MIRSKYLFLLFILFAISCKSANEKKQLKTEDASKIHKNSIIDGKVAPLLQQHYFFAQDKDVKSGTADGMKIEVKSGYEYFEKEHKVILDGKASVQMKAMGFGRSSVANFKEGKLNGVAYYTLSTPATYMLRLIYNNDQLQEASIFIMNETCLGYGPIKGKSLSELKTEFDKITTATEPDPDKFKTVECPKEMDELFR